MHTLSLRRSHPLAPLLAAAFTVLALTGNGVRLTAAQTSNATPTPAPLTGTIKTADYPIAIHEGTCESPIAQPAYPLTDATPWGKGAEETTVAGVNPGPAVPVSESAITAKLDDLTATPHVLAVHASAGDYGTLVACGQIAGIEYDNRLVIRLAPVNGGTISGIAVIEKGDGLHVKLGDRTFDLKQDQIRVTVYLTHL
ncbi:MAG: hypothetical protein ACR2OU_03280 [Thermomicrobiales bacterium]